MIVAVAFLLLFSFLYLLVWCGDAETTRYDDVTVS